jgi:Uncharacterized oxidoreductase dhs-27
VNHGVCRLENIFYGDSSSKEETGRTSVLDWQTFQMAGLTGLAADVSNFLVTSLFIKQRRSHEKEFLKEYYNAFMDGTGLTDEEYPFEQFMRNFVLGLQWQCFMVVFAGGRFEHADDTVANQAALKRFHVFYERVAAAVQDHDVMSASQSLACSQG